MKKILFTSVFIIATILSFSQVPTGFNYQSVIHNAEGELVTNQDINFRFYILEGSASGATVYSETQLVKSNNFGVCSIKVGTGADASGSLDDIDWGSNSYFLNVAVDITGSTSFTDIGTTELVSVPYALYAKNVESVDNEVLHFPGTDTLFAVKDRHGNIVFAVFPDGAKVYVNEGVKGPVGGFAVTGRNPGKAIIEEDYILVTPDSTRVWVNEEAKGRVGGFAVTGRNPRKGMSGDYLVVTSDSTRVYINDTTTTKGKVGGFAVTGRNPRKGPFDDYLHVTKDSTRVYVTESESKGPVGGFAVTGRNPGKGGITSDYFNVSGNTVADVIENESRVMWYPKKAALLAGEIYVGGPDSVGTNSTAIGYRNIAKGEYSQAFGFMSAARGNYSTAIGLEAKAEGVNSFAFGESAEAIGEGSYAIGSKGLDLFGGGFGGGVNTKALGYASISIGLGAVSIGDGAIAFGICDTAMGDYSMAIGHGSIATGEFSRTMGIYSKAEGYHSYAFGRNSEALAQDAISFASESVASGIYSVSLGAQSIASGDYSLAMGMNTIAEQGASVAMGTDTRASGWGSVVMGYNTIAKPRTLLVIGRNNDTTCISEGFGGWNSLDPAFIIGNGIDDNNRSNAFTVLQNGFTAIGHESPTEMLDVDGNARIRSVGTSSNSNIPLYITSTGILSTAASDIRLKTNILNLENSLEKVINLQGVSFNWKENQNGKRNVGFIAQEVEKVLPELVFTNSVDGYKGVNYAEMSAVLVEAIKEQQQIIDKQNEEVQDIKSKNEELEKKLNEILELLKEE